MSPEDESQLYALKEGLVNFLAHSDYFSPMHPTIRVYTDRIELQNPGSFHIPIDRLLSETISQPRNPAIIKLFRAAKLGENAGYGIDKIRKWKSLTGMDVTFSSEIATLLSLTTGLILRLPEKLPIKLPIKHIRALKR